MSAPSAIPPVPAKSAAEETPPRPRIDLLAGLLSYVIPGLGQIMQGRIAKGLLFLVSLHALFFYGMWLGQGKNVFLPHASHRGNTLERLMSDLFARPHFAGQFFIGMAAWPAVYQYYIYDPSLDPDRPEELPFRGFQRAPSSDTINVLQRDESKEWDLGWVYTVIAGVLNLLVIYDAIAGPAFREIKKEATKPDGDAKPEKELLSS